MKSWLLLISLLILMLHEAQGLRLTRESVSTRHHHNIPESIPDRRINVVVEEVVHYKSSHGSGRNDRKLMTKTSTHISSTDAMIKNDKTEGNKDRTKSEGKSRSEKIPGSNSSPVTEKQQPVAEPYPGILDIAGMDYSQARRKPPIHN
ncbi:uncharacterized protein LOC111390720 isoform X2 [Olea europaea var. sylvestris]|uniref:Uncharacterized protein n=1 Tax=Olea europaea subsp. europaea TaxID=158383 RepID=A0A8S0V774_OLEEU|nr:uncharacterized protein LOC111390720 isoform X2 [Olea europaea var. sylvestris]CAA3026543.1 Hypothetical predicted protein [Olea europaea subsp. europaea]